ncbi:MAG TPA: M3 family metallopeptidase [Opitutaceae bacterium]|nr:M3 family metallopeptidase [Opitutaceae bacterium]
MRTLRSPGWAALAALPLVLHAAPLRTLAEFQALAAPFNSEIRVPPFEASPEQIRDAAVAAMAAGDAAIDRLARQDPAAATFESMFGALDGVEADANLVESRLGFIQQTSPRKEMREAADEAAKRLQQWDIGIGYREDVYAALKSFAAEKPALAGEDQRLFDFTLRDYRRKGFELPAAARNELEALFKELSPMETDFGTNILKTRVALVFTRAELAGVPDSFLSSPGVKTGDDAYTILVNVTPQRLMVAQNCSVAATRRKVVVAQLRLGQDVNVPLLNRIVALRAEIARKLGYASWDDYKIEVKMAKNGAAATRFIEDLIRGIQPKFDAELAEMRALKVAETGDPHAQIEFYDWRYYQNQLVKQKYTVDSEALRVYFPYERSLQGMFAIYQSIFGLRFEQLQAPYVWADGVTLWGVTDAQSGEPMGLFYLDMFPREGKFNHFAEFPIQPGRLLPGGAYLRPTVALVCNFPPPANGAPSLLDHQEVTTLFHEFGHAMHAILTRAHRGRFSGTSVPGDFVEAPSQMLENWTYDKSVLDTFAADYRDPAKKVPAETLARLKEVRLATIGVFYRGQLSFALLDLRLHGPRPEGAAVDCQAESNRIQDTVFLPVPDDTALVAFFGHLAGGYDAGYYGYAWADAIAADMATVFEAAPGGFLDRGAGMRMRREIYSQGDARDVSVSIEEFLGRPRSIAPFLRKLGIRQGAAPEAGAPAR